MPLSLDEMRDGRKCDLLVIGSCAVDVRSGARLGKGEGFAELEYAIMRMMGTIDESTLVVTTVHDTQLLDGGEIDTRRLLRHDVPVDLIVTPTRTIWIDKAAQPAKPEGIYWDLAEPAEAGAGEGAQGPSERRWRLSSGRRYPRVPTRRCLRSPSARRRKR